MHRRVSCAAALTCAVVILASCTDVLPGGSTGTAKDDPSVAVRDVVGGSVQMDEIIDFTATAFVAHGGVEAFARMWVALDHGYLLTQLLPAGDAIEGDGRIDGVTPGGAPLGLFTEPPVAIAVAAGSTPIPLAGSARFDGDSKAQQMYVAGVSRTLAEIWFVGTSTAMMLPDAQDPDAQDPDAQDPDAQDPDAQDPDAQGSEDFSDEQQVLLTLVSAVLLARGYDPEQVIEALALGTWRVVGIDRSGCVDIEDVIPANPRDLLVGEGCRPIPGSDGVAAGSTDAPVDEPDDGIDGTYEADLTRGPFVLDFFPTLDSGGAIRTGEGVLEVVDGLAALTVVFEATEVPRFIGSDDRVLCVADELLTITADPQPLDDPAGSDLVATYAFSSVDARGEDCDGDDEDVVSESELVVRVGVAGPLAEVQLLFEGEPVGEPIQLTRSE